MPIYDKTSLYPYLPGYDGTIQERETTIRTRLKQLLKQLEQLEAKFGQNKSDISLLVDVERCQGIVRKLLD